MKNNYYFTLGSPVQEERNFIMFYKESTLSKDSISSGIISTESGDIYPLMPISQLKDYLQKNKWTVLYRDAIKMECDDELTDFIRSEKVSVIENDTDFDNFLNEYYKAHSK